MEKPTIMDIARRTGLSKGTVDRVLHNRGEVSKKSYDKVMEAVREMGYEPNMYASLLAKSQKRNIAVMLPEPEPGSYWELASRGIARVTQELRGLGVTARLFTYDQYSEEAFRECCLNVLAEEPAAVLLAPLFKADTLRFIEELEGHGIPFGFIDSKLEGTHYLVFYGIPANKSGYFCADILTGGEKVDEVLIVRIRRDKEPSEPTLSRYDGFMSYMQENYPDTIIHQLFIDPSDPAATDEVLTRFFAEFPRVRHIAMFNSRVHLLVPFLEHNVLGHPRIIGFDGIEANLNALRRGLVTMLIGQRPDQQVERALKDLAEFAVLHRQPARQNNFMHMLLLTRYNVDTN